MSDKAKKILKYLISAAVAVALLWLSFRKLSFRDFMTALRSCNWAFVLLSMFFGVCSFYFRGLRWRLLLLPIDSATMRGTCFNAVNISYVANLVLPRAGELIRCGYITSNSSRDKDGKHVATFDKVFGTVLVDRLWDVVVMLLLLLSLMFLMRGRFYDFLSGSILGPAAGAFNLSAMMIGIVAALLLFVLATILLKDKVKVFAKIAEWFRGIWTGVTSCLKMRQGWLFIVLTIGVWVMYWLMSATIVWAVRGMDLSFLGSNMTDVEAALGRLDMSDALLLMIAGAISSVVPVPGGFGAFHYVVSLTLSTLYGIPVEVGVIFATLSHESQTLVQILCGGASYVAETIKGGGKKTASRKRF